MARNTFKLNFRGTSVYVCRCCGRNTRDTGDNGSVEMCPECFDACSIENSLSDDHDNLTDHEREVLQAKVKAKFQSAVNKGGSITGYSKTK